MKQTVQYDKRLYSNHSIRIAIETFRPKYHVVLLPDLRDAIQVQFKSTGDLEEIIGEFNNYVIYLENHGGLMI